MTNQEIIEALNKHQSLSPDEIVKKLKSPWRRFRPMDSMTPEEFFDNLTREIAIYNPKTLGGLWCQSEGEIWKGTVGYWGHTLQNFTPYGHAGWYYVGYEFHTTVDLPTEQSFRRDSESRRHRETIT